MIFYFTGTGNTGYVASEIAKANNDTAISISKLMNTGDLLEFTLKDDEMIGFIFPTYAYAPPKIVVDFIRKIKFANFNHHYVFSVATCGVRSGNALRVVQKEMDDKGITLKSGFSIIMPNNKLRHGDEGERAVERAKFEKAKDEISRINRLLKERRHGVFEGIEAIQSRLSRSEFYHGDTEKFVVSKDCTACGRCEDLCQSHVVKVVGGKPMWDGACCLCWACVHNCPKNAIQYGQAKLKIEGYTGPYN